jgi:hypothetical protein
MAMVWRMGYCGLHFAKCSPPMKTNQRREAGLKALASTGMYRSNYEPPLLRLLWCLGLNARPPHFAPFWVNALVSGGVFGVAWGALMWFIFYWSRQGMSLTVSLIAATTTLTASANTNCRCGTTYRELRH